MTAVGSLIGFLIGNRLTIGRDKRKEFVNAINEFILAYKEFFAMLESDFRYQIGPFVAPIPEHLAAAIVFRQHLGFFRRRCFDREVAQYKEAAEKYDDEAEKCFGVKNIPHETTLKLVKSINSLLKYAKPK